MTDTGRIIEKAQNADREALFAALQAALVRIVDTALDRGMEAVSADLAEVERRLDYGHLYGHEFTQT